MSEVKWIKITTDMFEDEKIDFIQSLPESDAIIVIWVRLLTMAGKCNSNGYIFLTENIPYDENMLAHKFRKPLNIVRLAIKTFTNLNMIEDTEKGFLLPNWQKHQNIEGLDKIKEQNRKRVSAFREKQKLMIGSNECNVTSNVTVTESNDIDIDIDKELDKELERDIIPYKEIILTDDEEAFIDVLKEIKNYPVDLLKDKEMFNRLEEKFSNLDLLEVAREWKIYKEDKPLVKNSNARSQFNTSCTKYAEWGKCLKQEPINPWANMSS